MMRRIAILLALVSLPAIAWGQQASPSGSSPARLQQDLNPIGSAADYQDTDFLAKSSKKEPLSSDPAKRLEQIKKQKEQFAKQKAQQNNALKLKVHKDLNDLAKTHIDKYLKQQLAERYPEQSFPRDYKEIYCSDVVDLPSQPNYYTMRVDYVVDLKNKASGSADKVSRRCFTLDGNLKVVGSLPAALQEKEVREFLGTTEKKARPTREQLKKEAAELKEMKRKPTKPGDPQSPNP